MPYASYGSPQTLNLYAFVGNNPLSQVDADGHQFYRVSCSDGTAGQCGIGTNPFADGIYDANGMNSGGADPVAGQENFMYDQAGWEADNPAQQQTGSSSGGGFWRRLGQHLGNLFSGHSWNHGMRFVVTHRILSPSESEAVTDVAQGVKVAAAVGAGPKVGAIGTLMSIASNPSPPNIGMNLLPWAFPELRLPMAFGGAAWDASKFTANHVIVPVFTPDTLQSDTINANGITVQDPQAAFDSGNW